MHRDETSKTSTVAARAPCCLPCPFLCRREKACEETFAIYGCMHRIQAAQIRDTPWCCSQKFHKMLCLRPRLRLPTLMLDVISRRSVARSVGPNGFLESGINNVSKVRLGTYSGTWIYRVSRCGHTGSCCAVAVDPQVLPCCQLLRVFVEASVRLRAYDRSVVDTTCLLLRPPNPRSEAPAKIAIGERFVVSSHLEIAPV